MALGRKDGEFAKCEAGKEDLVEYLMKKFASDPIFNRMFA